LKKKKKKSHHKRPRIAKEGKLQFWRKKKKSALSHSVPKKKMTQKKGGYVTTAGSDQPGETVMAVLIGRREAGIDAAERRENGGLS